MTSPGAPASMRADPGLFPTALALGAGLLAALAFLLLHAADAAVVREPFRTVTEQTEHAARLDLTVERADLVVESSCECVHLRRTGTLSYEAVVICAEIPAKVLPGVHVRSPSGHRWFVPLDCD